jgi:hypothetical protein
MDPVGFQNLVVISDLQRYADADAVSCGLPGQPSR